uniref:Uncharacterized protein n=1 Tax=Chlamydomonas euryale TaxID=1486919 RepID=A0A7R9VM47_9CHLO|mmetsp:Transcript_38137/g.112970  ORF Transcript_38137/g.112970 Transcript_38137/m.112970 type:complete len:236 (+) Transcript_38137:557-1264(+)
MPLTLRLAAAGGAAAAAPSCKRARSSAATRQCRGWHGGGLVVAKCVPFGTPQKRRADGLGAVPRRAVSAAAAARPPLDGVFFASAAAPNGGLFPELDRQFDEIDRQFAEMNRQMDRELADVFGRTDAMVQQQRERTQQLREGALREARERTPNVAIERYEDRGDGRYMYYESIQVRRVGGWVGRNTLRFGGSRCGRREIQGRALYRLASSTLASCGAETRVGVVHMHQQLMAMNE